MLHIKPTPWFSQMLLTRDDERPVSHMQLLCGFHRIITFFCMVHMLNTKPTISAIINYVESFLACIFQTGKLLTITWKRSEKWVWNKQKTCAKWRNTGWNLCKIGDMIMAMMSGLANRRNIFNIFGPGNLYRLGLSPLLPPGPHCSS